MAIMRGIAAFLGLTFSLASARAMADEPPAPGDDAAGATHQGGGATGSGKLAPVKPPPLPTDVRAYQLYWEVDAPLLTIAIVFGLGRTIRGGLAPAFCAPIAEAPTEQATSCNPDTLNWLDRHVAGHYQPGWGRWSDVGLYSLEALAAGGILATEGLRSGVNDLVVVAEATLLASAAAGVSTAITGRPRPYMFGTNAPLAVRRDGNGGLSFFSGHTSTAFSVVTATFVTMHRLHPRARWPWLVLGGGVAAAGFIGATRILAGWHFPTDVAAGVAVGTSIGLLVPALHEAPRHLAAVPMAMASGGGLALTGTFP